MGLPAAARAAEGRGAAQRAAPARAAAAQGEGGGRGAYALGAWGLVAVVRVWVWAQVLTAAPRPYIPHRSCDGCCRAQVSRDKAEQPLKVGVRLARTQPRESVGVGFVKQQRVLRVSTVDAGGLAEAAGLKVDDRILTVNGLKVADLKQMTELLSALKPKVVCTVVVSRTKTRQSGVGQTDSFKQQSAEARAAQVVTAPRRGQAWSLPA